MTEDKDLEYRNDVSEDEIYLMDRKVFEVDLPKNMTTEEALAILDKELPRRPHFCKIINGEINLIPLDDGKFPEFG